jgi:5-methylcytosine-specific restriction endonuclease McrA
MHFSIDSSSLIFLLVLAALLIVGLGLLQPARRRRRRQTGRARHSESRPPKKARGWLKRFDHWVHRARQHGHERSPEWSSVQKEHRLREPACVACGYKGRWLQVHHIKPFHLYPQLELDPNNLITLCERPRRNHHLLLGHLGAWKSYNEHVREDAKHFYRKNARQIKADIRWQKKVKQRP